MNIFQKILKNVLQNVLFFLIILISISSCEKNTEIDYEISDDKTVKPLVINPDSIKIVGDLGTFQIKKDIKEKDGIQLITFSFLSETPSELQPVTIEFNFPSIDINGYWNPSISVDRVNYYYSRISSKVSRYAPILSFYNNNLDNRITISLSDALNKSEFMSYLKEEDVHFYPRIRLFDEKMPKTKSYTLTLRIDTRTLPYYEVIDDVASWWANMPVHKPMHVPEDAKMPMYSTWYSYHQSISAEEIVAECKIAKTLGCGAVIIDDGWQTKDSNRGYAYTGDWKPERIPNMKEFVDAVHKEGMKFILWYSLPFIGEKAKNFNRFKGKYLWHWKPQNTYVLDPRYPEVREFIINTYIKALKDWDLDGFKIDFIARFTAQEDTKLTKENGRDYASVNEAVDALMTEITQKLTALKPDILIEFRQPYIGPLMRKYGNMFRGVDAPNNAVANRIETVNLRIMAQNTAVHSDMFIWRPEEPVEKAALQILNILYSVPQLSVKLAEIPEDHMKMIKFWFAYWSDHKDILLDGKFIPSDPVANYPILTVIGTDHQITTVYEDMVINVKEDIKQIDIINAKASNTVIIDFEFGFKGQLVIKDCMGEIVFEKQVKFAQGISKIKVPMSGIINLKLK